MTTPSTPMTTPPSNGHATRWGLAAGAVGLVAGLGLGVTGLAGATSPAPTPKDGSAADAPPHQRPGHPGLRKAMERQAGGLVSSISATSITVRTPGGTRTVGLDGSTTFYDGKTKVTASAVEVGDVVHVRLVDPRAGSPVAAVVRVLPASVAGWVTAKDGGRLTVVDHDGFTRVIQTGSGTEVVKDGAKSSLAAVAVGSFVHAVGSVADDGTTLDATHLRLGVPPRNAKRAGERPPPDDAEGEPAA